MSETAPVADLPTSPEAVIQRLADLGIAVEVHRHPPVFTVEESQALRGDMPGGHIKNLFLRNKKGDQMWLVVVEETRRMDLKALAPRIGGDKLSFGSADRLMTYLGVRPGAVTPLALINDKDHKVQPVLDRALLSMDPLHCHPLTNDMTLSLAPSGLLRFIEACGHKPIILDL
ncbi:MAG TPA: prolyl-tRNA synthetase associated domain-containing protein [Hypericibacter adhaerens]|jgi:Ala-tRNA(Pro) deacylase|uniref:DNA-binding protein n=1 Tax=Hypericibacter adhaerens TaxID=2602016 RepID=A0A5J6N5H8_9PROT|nr:prolyl-tRNA synthetase associated domain-containing protein [Hypericibacter adhaerens]QEX25169.1 DNA-binding protein [Hypericibacter adhaerens]HWA42017.1 prolyl-tRNA synthetase associated domain-containing protein [Hypericibacter adhaerens]